jgi:hypothetical protein
MATLCKLYTNYFLDCAHGPCETLRTQIRASEAVRKDLNIAALRAKGRDCLIQFQGGARTGHRQVLGELLRLRLEAALVLKV